MELYCQYDGRPVKKLKDYEKWCFKVAFLITMNTAVIWLNTERKQEEILSLEFSKVHKSA